jgi:phospholipase/carboxylesterase
MIRRRLGDLDCVIAGGTDGQGGGDGPTVILMHGFGAGGDDLVDLANYVEVPPGTRWVFPAGPLELGGLYGDSRAWWMIDLARLEPELAAGRAIDRADEVPDGLPAARAAVLGLLDALARDYGRTDARTVLGGFSQGAMLTVDVALHAPGKLAGLALMSGTLLAESVWQPRAAALAGVTIFQSHGTKDGLLAYRGAERLRDFLLAAGAEVGFMPFPGGHELPPPVLEGLAELLARTLAA